MSRLYVFSLLLPVFITACNPLGLVSTVDPTFGDRGNSTTKNSSGNTTTSGGETSSDPVTIRHVSKTYGFNQCVTLSDGTVKCWGETGFGVLGLGLSGGVGDESGEMGDALTAIDFGAGKYATQIALGTSELEYAGYHACAILNDGSVKCWGRNTFGQLGIGSTADKGQNAGDLGDALPVVDLGTGRTATQLALGGFHSCALLDNATVKCWGYNVYGQLGQGNTNDLGDGAGEMGDSLAAINLGTGRTATAIVSGIYHVCALLDNSTVKCWGYGAFGNLGQGSGNRLGDGAGEMGDALAAISLGTGRTATSIAAGGSTSCAILDDATLKCWGYNSFGQLGKGNTSHLGDGAGEMGDSLAVISLGTGRTAVAVQVLLYSVCVILDDASTKCWGLNSAGQLGLGTNSNLGDGAGEMGDALATVNVGTGRTVSELSGNGYSVCAKLDNAQLKCWGLNSYGQLGIGSISAQGDSAGEMGDSLAAVNLGTGRTVLKAAAAVYVSCAIRDDNSTVCWGHNGSGIVKNENSTIGDSLNEMGSNLATVDLGSGFNAVKTEMGGTPNACALSDVGTVKCWGRNADGQLGQNNTVNLGDTPGEMGDNLPTVNFGTGLIATDIALGLNHACVIVSSGKVKCWGYNSYGGLGIGGTAAKGDTIAPAEMGDTLAYTDLGTGRTAKKIALGYFSTCAILDNDTVKCWGYNSNGQLGLGDTATRGDGAGEMGDSLPTVDLGSGRTAKEIALGGYFACALLDNNSVKCWGKNSNGQLGQGDALDRGDAAGEMGDNLLAIDLGTSRYATAIAVGVSHACATLDNGDLKCWGNGGYGQLGYGNALYLGDGASEMGDNLAAVNIGTGRTVAQINTGVYSTMVVDDLGNLKGFGMNGTGQLGLGHVQRIGDNAGEMGDNLLSVSLGIN